MSVDYGTLRILKKLRPEASYQVYWDLYRRKDNKEEFDSYIHRLPNGNTFGELFFYEREDGIFIEHRMNDMFGILASEKSLENDIRPEWLLCFDYSEMKVIGITMGVFVAETTVEKALKRLEEAIIPQSEQSLDKARRELWDWLKEFAHPDDRIRCSSNWIFYSENEEYDYYYVRNFINSRIRELKRKNIVCSHWTNKTKKIAS